MSGDPERTATLTLSSGPMLTFGTTGCIAEARRALYTDAMTAARISYLPQEAYLALYHRIVADPAVKAAMSQWSSCMRVRGYDYATPDDARAAMSEARSSSDRSTAPELEKRVAVADGECALQVDLPQTVVRVGRTYAASCRRPSVRNSTRSPSSATPRCAGPGT